MIVAALVVVIVLQSVALALLALRVRLVARPRAVSTERGLAELEPIPPPTPREQALAFSEGVAVARIAEGVLPSSTRR